MDPGTAKIMLSRLALVALAQTLLEIGVCMFVFVEAGIWSDSPYKDSAYQIVIFFANLQRGWIMRELLRKLAATPYGEEPDISFALGGVMRVFLFNPLALTQWYVLQFVMRGTNTHELPLFVVLAVLNIGQCIWWYRTMRILAWGRPPQPQVESLRITDTAAKEFIGQSCVICLAEFVEGEEVGKLPCNHAFHGECIREWLKRGDQCPMRCKHSARTSSTSTQEEQPAAAVDATEAPRQQQAELESVDAAGGAAEEKDDAPVVVNIAPEPQPPSRRSCDTECVHI